MLNTENQIPTNIQLAHNILRGLYNNEPTRLAETANFFKNAFIDLCDHDLFEEQTSRVEWQANINFIASLNVAFKGWTREQIDAALKEVIELLEKKLRKEAQHA